MSFEISLPFVIMIVSIVSFVVAMLVTVRSMGKEKPTDLKEPLITIIVQAVFLIVYSLLTNLSFFSPLILVIFLAGSALGLLAGRGIKVYRKMNQIISKRSMVFLVFWTVSVVLNQLLITVGFFKGLALTVFATATVIGSEGTTMLKISRARPVSEAVEKEVMIQPPTVVGLPINSGAVCARCGNPVGTGKRFCTRCGARISELPDR